MLADVRCAFLVREPTSEAEVKRAIRDDLIEPMTVVGVVCKLVRSCLLVFTFDEQHGIAFAIIFSLETTVNRKPLPFCLAGQIKHHQFFILDSV